MEGWIDEMKDKGTGRTGHLTLRGKVPTKYFVKRFYGVEDICEIPQEEGKEWFHA